jgi:hypothetical protein
MLYGRGSKPFEMLRDNVTKTKGAAQAKRD